MKSYDTEVAGVPITGPGLLFTAMGVFYIHVFYIHDHGM